MSEPAENSYDVIVVGAGPVGLTAADRARAAGLSVAVVERELVGGECSYWACIPSKAMLRPVVAVADARRVAGARQAVMGPVDAPAVFTRRDGYVTNWNDEDQASWLKSIGAPVGSKPPAQAQIALSALTVCGGAAVARLGCEDAGGLPLRIQPKGQEGPHRWNRWPAALPSRR